MNDSKLRSVAQIKAFLAGTREVGFSVQALGDDARYDFVFCAIKRLRYAALGKKDKGVVRQYVMHCTGYGRAQITRLIARVLELGSDQLMLKRYCAPKTAYAGKYTAADIALLIEVDAAYNNACGATTIAVFKRQLQVYGDQRFERLAHLSVSHLYNLRASRGYQNERLAFTKTRPVKVPIGVRKAPQPNGHAGYIRVDTVHQGDEDKQKGVYHITLVDSVSQWDITCCVQGISEAYLLAPLELCIAHFPFEILGFHSDNGSEYINGRVAKLLEKLRIEQTKSRARHSNDNALAESKNNSVVRRHMGYEHIPRHLANPINAFYVETFNPWVNHHRPCLYASEETNAKGKVVKKYLSKDVQTPLDKLTALCASHHAVLKAGITLKALHEEAHKQSDLVATQQMQAEKHRLWVRILKAKKSLNAKSSSAAEHHESERLDCLLKAA